MVKFSKQFEGQLVPEWKEAFVDYWQLKKDIKKIHVDGHRSANSKMRTSSLRQAVVSSLRKYTFLHHKQREPSLIQVHRKLEGTTSKADLYETEVADKFTNNTDGAVEFFACLDFQLNKVNQFFRTKEKEFLERGDSLKKQMEILTELKTALNRKRAVGASCNDSKDQPDSISEEESIKYPVDTEEKVENVNEEVKENEIKLCGSSNSGELTKSMRKSFRIDIPTTTFSTITYLLLDGYGPEGNKWHVNKKKLHHAEKLIKGAVVELYKGLGYLKIYRNLNMLAFVKILKKFDKVTNKQVLPIYLKVVESSYFNSSDKVLKLADEVEETFIKNFAGDDKRMAMKYLKPTQRKESHTVTFFIGLFAGCFLALFIAYVIIAHITRMYRSNSDKMYMETVYPVLSMFSLLFLHLFLFGCNVFVWRKTRINYTFIFELSPTKELKYRDVFLICATSMAAVVGVLFLHLMLIEKRHSCYQVQAIPGLLLLAFITILICPFNIFYKSSRCRLLSVLRNIVLSPFYKVAMLDFFMADQLCSQIPMLRNMEYIACYYITESYKTQDYNYCMRSTYYRDLAYAISFLPYYWRAMQCARRWFDEGQKSHLTNLGKYVSAMLAAGAKVAYEKEKNVGWLCLLIVMSTLATVYQLYWDFVKDWGLLQFNSKNSWLTDELALRHKFIYYFSLGLNLVLRLAWLQTFFHYSFEKVDYRVTMLFLAALEVVRRGQWNFYRLENEHLNNAGKFRAVKTVPLPFHEVDEQE